MFSRTQLPANDEELYVATFLGSPTDTPTPCSTPGSLDTDFDGDGKVVTRFGSGSVLSAIALQADSKVVAAGSVETGTGTKFLVVRYNVDGSLDETFAGDGYAVTEFGGSRAGQMELRSNLTAR